MCIYERVLIDRRFIVLEIKYSYYSLMVFGRIVNLFMLVILRFIFLFRWLDSYIGIVEIML